jgi:hypothetical protein
MKKQTVVETIIRYRELGKEYETAGQKLPEPIKSSFLKMAYQLYKSANDLEETQNEA